MRARSTLDWSQSNDISCDICSALPVQARLERVLQILPTTTVTH